MRALALLLLLGTARADWTTADYALQGVTTLALGADWLQTRQAAARRCLGRPCGTEMNPVLGPAPTLLAVDAYFAAAVVGHAAISALLPRPYRTIWQATWFGVEAATVHRNYSAGVTVRF